MIGSPDSLSSAQVPFSKWPPSTYANSRCWKLGNHDNENTSPIRFVTPPGLSIATNGESVTQLYLLFA